MTRKILRTLSIMCLAVSVVLYIKYNENPIKTTEALSAKVVLKNGIVLKEKLDINFDYSYVVKLYGKIDSTLSNNNPFTMILVLSQDEKIIKKQIFVTKSNFFRNFHFVALKDNNYELKVELKNIKDTLINKSIHLDVDVAGGGPSVGMALEEELKYFTLIELVILIILTLFLGVLSYVLPKDKVNI